MGWMRKQTGLGLVVAAAGLLGLAGCTTDPVSSGDIEYDEIRVDLFSNMWLTQRLNADFINGDTLFYGDDNDLEYAMVLLDTSRNKISSLPAYVVQTSEFEKRVLYTTNREPENFSCQLRRTGELMTIPADDFAPNQIPDGAIFASLEDFGFGFVVESYTGVYDFEEWRTTFCTYLPGKGFYIQDMWGTGEVIIRY